MRIFADLYRPLKMVLMGVVRHRQLRWIASWLVLAAMYFVTRKLGLRLVVGSRLEIPESYVGVMTMMSMAVAATVWDLKRAEFQLRESEQRLLRHSADLEQFAWAASHDLREPLQTVSLFAQLLAEQYAEPLGKEAHEFIDRIVGDASRMEVLITGLLNYSLLSHSKTRSGSKVSVDEVVGSVQKNWNP
jgi:signal transduction histidine kinase